MHGLKLAFTCLVLGGVLAGMYGCAGSAVDPAAPARLQSDPAAVPVDAYKAGFALEVLDATLPNPAAAGSVSLIAHESADGSTLVEVALENASGLRGFFCTLDYDQSRFALIAATSATFLDPDGEIVELADLSQKGQVHFGAALMNFNERAGVSGSGSVARFTFVPVDRARRLVQSVPPLSPLSAVNDLAVDPTGRLTWTYSFQGDYDQNGEVNVADLTPVAMHWARSNQTSSGLTMPWKPSEYLCAVDGDANGEINVADLVPISGNFQRDALGGYALYYTTDLTSPSPDYPAGPAEANGPGARSGGIKNLAGAVNHSLRSTQRLRFVVQLQGFNPDMLFWVRPLSSENYMGIPSNIATQAQLGAPQLSLTGAARGGSGTQADPYVVDRNDEVRMRLLDKPGGSDVSADSETVYTIDGPDYAGRFIGASWTLGSSFPADPFTITAQHRGMASNALHFKVEVGSNPQAPTITLSASPASGVVPLLVNFTANASDPNGSIVKYEWDFQSDGVYDLDSTTISTVDKTYETLGSFTATVRVTDNDGQQATATTGVTVLPPGGGQPPTVTLSANPASGAAPLNVTLTANASDPDGTITQYAWDFDGNGTYDSTGTTASALHQYTGNGSYSARVQVTDNQGLTATAQATVTVGSVGPNPETPIMQGRWQRYYGTRRIPVAGPSQGTFAWDLDIRNELDDQYPAAIWGPVTLADGTVLITARHVDGRYLHAIRENAGQASASKVASYKLGTYGGGEDLVLGNTGIIYTIDDPRTASGQSSDMRRRIAMRFNGSGFDLLWVAQPGEFPLPANTFLGNATFVSKANQEVVFLAGGKTINRFKDSGTFQPNTTYNLLSQHFNYLSKIISENNQGDYYLLSNGYDVDEAPNSTYLLSVNLNTSLEPRWMLEVPVGYGTSWSTAPNALPDGTVYIGTNAAFIFCIGQSGTIKWHIDTLPQGVDSTLWSIGLNHEGNLVAMTENKRLVLVAPGESGATLLDTYRMDLDPEDLVTEPSLAWYLDLNGVIYQSNYRGSSNRIISYHTSGGQISHLYTTTSYSSINDATPAFAFTANGSVFMPSFSQGRKILGIK